MNKNKMFSMLLVIAMVMSLFVVPANASAENKENETKNVVYSFNLSDIPQKDWDAAKVKIVLHVKSGDETKDITIPVDKEGYGHATLMGLHVYENGVKTDRAMSVTVVPARLLSEYLDIPITWQQETQSFTIKSYKGDVTVPLGAREINLPDGTTFKEETYFYPDGSPIQLAMMRAQEGRSYLPIRAFASIVFSNEPGEEPVWKWDRPGVLEGWVTMPKTQSGEKDWVGTRPLEDLTGGWHDTYSVKDNPAVAAVIKETNATVNKSNGDLGIRPADAYSSNSIWLEIHDHSDYAYGEDDRLEYWLYGLGSYVGMHDEEDPNTDYLKVVKVLLGEIVSDNDDVEAIYKIVEDADKTKSENRSAQIHVNETLNTVIVQWDTNEYGVPYELRIYNKLP